MSNRGNSELPLFPEPVGIGAGRSAFSLANKDKKDIGDQGINEEVHGFAANDKSVLPQPWRRVKEAYPANGVFNPKFEWLDKPAAFAQKDKNDIGNKKIDEEVHGFATNDKNVLPEPWSRADEANPMVMNGSLAKPAFAQKQDIGDQGINEVVQNDFWDSTKDVMVAHFKNGNFKQGLIGHNKWISGI